MKKNITQLDIVMEFYYKNPGREISHPEVVDWVVDEYKRRTGKIFRDPDRAIRKLAQNGTLIKIKKGIYKYDPDSVINRELEDFTSAQKRMILERDNYKCVVCGLGPKNGVELHVDHIKPKDLGGKATIENGQTLCSQHNFIKKNFNQTETAKKMFVNLLALAKKEKNKEIEKFCLDILEIYEKHKINGHITWEK